MTYVKKFFVTLALIFSATIFSTASANSMPREEMYVGGVGYGCKLGYVKELYGEPLERKEFVGDGVRIVTYFYSKYFSVTTRTAAEDISPEERFSVVGFSLKDNSLSTPSGFTVGMNYNEVVKLFGRGELYEYNGRTGYFYVPSDSGKPITLTFYVDDMDTITEIELGTDW